MTGAVCVFCASGTRIDPRYLTLAAEVGEALGRRGWQLVSGGGSISSMGALARAARAAGAHTVGVIPRALLAYEVADTEADELLVTEDMRDRKATMDSRADAFLVLPGGIGTMEEFFEAWVGRVLGMHHKPVVVLDPWGDYAALHELIDTMVAGRFVPPDVAAEVTWVRAVADALDAIAGQWASPPPPHPAGLAEAIIELEAD
ncbi:MAG: hypothetical protein QG597_3107 [Actinomycetota bacterium]|nr:hypothetical protein [Actinomycetota bacterium]